MKEFLSLVLTVLMMQLAIYSYDQHSKFMFQRDLEYQTRRYYRFAEMAGADMYCKDSSGDLCECGACK